MSKHRPPFNPSSFSDALTEKYYAKNIAKRKKLKRKRQKLVNWLRKKAKSSQRAQGLADKLETCRRKHRCKSGACPECAAAAQRLFAKAARRYLKGKSGVACVTIVPADGTTTRGGLVMSITERFIRRTKEKFGRAHDGIFIGAVDLSLNEFKEKKHKPYWCQHVHGITVTNDTKALKRELKKEFPPTDTIPRPVKVEEWDGEPAALRYPMKPKPKRDRRISTDNGKRFNKKTGKNRKCRATDKQPLKSKDKLELLSAPRHHRDSGTAVSKELAVHESQGYRAYACGSAIEGTYSRKSRKG